MTPVAIPIPLEPNKFVKRIVANDAAPIFTKLFPIRIVIKSLWGFFFILKRAFAPLFSCFKSALTLIMLSDIIAVSVPEKNPDKTNP